MNDAQAQAAPPTMQDLTDELYREYQFVGPAGGLMTYRVNNPQGLVVGKTTHRVLDSEGVVHCVPNIGHFGCVLRWKVKEGATPIRF